MSLQLSTTTYLIPLVCCSYFLVFACHIVWHETATAVPRTRSKPKPKTFIHVLAESCLSLHVVVFSLAEIGVSRDFPLDFRAHFLSTWLGLTVLGAFPVSLGARPWVSVVQVKERKKERA